MLWGRFKNHWTDYLSQLAGERLDVLPEEPADFAELERGVDAGFSFGDL